MNKYKRELANDYQLNIEKAEIQSMSQVIQNTNSQMFSLEITTGDSIKAKTIANVQSDIFKEEALDILAIAKVTILSEATINTNPVSPNTKLNLMIGAILGLMLGGAGVFLFKLLDKIVKGQDYTRDVLNIPVLGSVLKMTQEELSRASSVTIKDEIPKEVNKPKKIQVMSQNR